MPAYYFRIPNGPFSDALDHRTDFADDEAAWEELTSVCGDLVGSTMRNLTRNSEWRMELLDETKKCLFRVRLVAETMKRNRE